MSKAELIKTIFFALKQLQFDSEDFTDINMSISSFMKENPDIFVSSYERTKVLEHLESAKSGLWSLLGQLCEYNFIFLDEEFIKRQGKEPKQAK